MFIRLSTTCFLLLFVLLTVIQALYEKGVKLPKPKKILGGLEVGGVEVDEPCLRETEEHANFLFCFAKCVLPADTFRTYCTTRKLSAYMSINLEAFAVVTYVNK